MPTTVRYPTIDTPVSGSWTDPTNVQAADNATASAHIAVPGQEAERSQAGYGFDSAIPLGSTIQAVRLETRQRVSVVGSGAVLETFLTVSGADSAVYFDQADPLSLTDRSYNVPLSPSGAPWTRAALLDAVLSTTIKVRVPLDTLGIRVTEEGDTRHTEAGDIRLVEQSGDGTAVTAHWDYVRLSVDYTETTLTVELWQGATLIATRELDSLTATPTDYEFELTSTERDLITAPADLEIRLISGTEDQRVTASWVELTGAAPPLIVLLMQGPTVITSWVIMPLTAVLNDFEFSLSPAEVAMITNPNALQLRFISGAGDQRVTKAWVEISGTSADLIVIVMQGGTPIATRVLLPLTPTTTDFQFVLTAEELALITDPDNLFVTLISGKTDQRVTHARLELNGSPVVVVDLTPPLLVSASPVAGATNVNRNTDIVLTFNEPIKRGSGTLVLRSSNGVVLETFNVATSTRIFIGGNTIVIDPSITLPYNTEVFFDVPLGAIRDLSNNPFAGLSTYSFTTLVDTTGPVVIAYDPIVGATNVSLVPAFTLTFDEPIVRGSGTIVLRTSTGTVIESFDAATSPLVFVSGNIVTVDPSVVLNYNTTYFLDFPAGSFTDVVGNPYAGTTGYFVSTANQTLQVVDFDPEYFQLEVPVNYNITLTFNAAIQRGVGNLVLMAAPNQVLEVFNVATSSRLTFNGNQLIVDPTNALPDSRFIVLQIPAGAIKDLSGSSYSGTSSYGFFTVYVPGAEDWMPGSIPPKGFWVALATSDHNRSAITVELDPAPTRVDYPSEPLGEVVETSDGRVVHQQLNKDPRRRSWVWANYGPSIQTYERQFRWLEGLRSRYRQQTGQSPYIYVYDGTTNLLNKRQSLTTPLISRTGNELTVADFTSIVHPSVLRHATVDLYVDGETSASQRVSVEYATDTTLTVYPDVQVTGTVSLTITWLEPSWWKVRVLDTTRTPLESGLMKYAESKFVFVIEDPDWTEVG